MRKHSIGSYLNKQVADVIVRFESIISCTKIIGANTARLVTGIIAQRCSLKINQ